MLGSIILQWWHLVQSCDFPHRLRSLRVRQFQPWPSVEVLVARYSAKWDFGEEVKSATETVSQTINHEAQTINLKPPGLQLVKVLWTSCLHFFPALPSLSVDKWSDCTRRMAKGTKFHCSAALNIYAMWKNHLLSLSLLPSPMRHHSHWTEWPTSKYLQRIDTGEGVGKTEPSCVIGGL